MVGIVVEGDSHSGSESPHLFFPEPLSTATWFQDPPEGFILNYTLLIGDDSFSNFQKVRNTFDRQKSFTHDSS